MITKKCLICNKEFKTYPCCIKIGRGKFCSKSCANSFNQLGEKHWNWKGGEIIKQCLNCYKDFFVKPSRIKNSKGKYCSKKCFNKSLLGKSPWNKGLKFPQFSGNKSPNWKGGKFNSRGYIYIYSSNHPNAHFHCITPYIQEHRLIVEKYLGRYLEKQERIHHINGIKNDNHPENLYLFPNLSKHTKFHRNPYQLISNII